jgi:hypothetical protein
MTKKLWRRIFFLALKALGVLGGLDAQAAALPEPASGYADGYGRPRALDYNPVDGHVYVALSTRNEVVVLDGRSASPRVLTSIKTGRFPQALAVLPTGEVLVGCRYEPELGLIPPRPETLAESARYRRLPAGATHGRRGLATYPQAGVAYVASPADGGVYSVSLSGAGPQGFVETGLSPRTVRVLSDPQSAERSLLFVINFIGRTVTVFDLHPDGSIGELIQTIATAAPVHDLLFVPLPQPTLVLLTHEDRATDRSQPFVAGLDSVLLLLPAAPALSRSLPFLGPQAPPFVDAGTGHRLSINLTERSAPLVKLDALAYDAARQRLAIVGAASDNVLLLPVTGLTEPAELARRTGVTVPVGRNPVALSLLPDGRILTADRLSDTLSLLPLSPTGQPVRQVVLGQPDRRSAAALGELLFYSRALLPHNTADGERSLYSCSACHDDGHVDGRLHPARNNRFYSMTKTCRGIASTAPYLFLGEIADIDAFARNILSSHAQGADVAPDTFDQYATQVPVFRGGRFVAKTLSPRLIRESMAAYLRTLPPEPSPFVAIDATELPEPARRGLRLFQQGCARCHKLVGNSAEDDVIADEELQRRLLRGQVALTSRERYDVGPKVLGNGGNNPPSLRGVWDNAPYFSDGSAATLDEVLRRSTLDPMRKAHDLGNSWPGPALSAEERADLLAFLLCL